MDWKPFPDGNRVKHRDKGYEGWIDGLTEVAKGGKVNPDGKSKYRIRLHNRERRELAAEQEIEDRKDLETIFRSTATLLHKRIDKQSIDRQENDRWREWNRLLPLPCTIWALGEYHSLTGGDVTSRGNHTSQILNVKKGALPTAVNYFVGKLDEILSGSFPICIIPSSNPSTTSLGLREIIQGLAQNGRVDASSSLIRHEAIIPSQSATIKRPVVKKYGLPLDADRENIHRHLDSIKVVDSSVIRSRVVLLLDDIVTTGTSFMACRKLLLDAGASEVVCLALGITKRVRAGK